MHGAIAKKDTPFGTESMLACIVRTEIRPRSITKSAKSIIIRCNMKETLSWRLKINDLSRKQINEKNSSEKSFIPIFNRHICISK
jgi:hypothetical protein